MTIKSKLLIVSFLLTILFVFVVLYQFFYFGDVTIRLSGDFNPASDRVYVDKKQISSAGEAGRVYTVKVRPGSRPIKIVGPQIQSQSRDVSVRVFGSTVAEMKINKDAEKYLTLTDEKILRQKLYGPFSDWLLLGTTKTGAQGDISWGVYRFQYSEDTWKRLVKGEKINSSGSALQNAPQELIEDVDLYAGD